MGLPIITTFTPNTRINSSEVNANFTNLRNRDQVGASASADLTLLGNLLLQGTWDGWLNTLETPGYASATTMTVASGATSRYKVGDKIKLTQSSTTKYFYIVGVTSTTLTITGGSDYTLTNNAITNFFVARGSNPIDFPDVFNYTPTISASGSMTISASTIGVAKFKIEGKIVHLIVQVTGITTAGTASTLIKATLPVNTTVDSKGAAVVRDSAFVGSICETSGTHLDFASSTAIGGWGIGSSREVYGQITYMIGT